MLLAASAGLTARVHHVDHGVRPDGEREAALVESLAASVGMGFVHHVVEVPPGGNLEARARAARRSVLPRDVLTAHTMDDQAETVLLNLLRGSGLDGLAAMAPRTKPLLGVRRGELRDFVAQRGVPVVVDPSNYDLSQRRNLVRARVLPELCRVAGRDLVPLLARQADVLRGDAAFLDAAAAAALPDYLDARALRSAPAALRRRRLRDLVRDACHKGYPATSAEVDRLDAVVAGEAVAAELTGGIRVSRSEGRLRVQGN